MKVFNLFKGNKTKELTTALPVYKVSWTKFYSPLETFVKMKEAVRFFTNEEEANEFAEQLRQSYKLLEVAKGTLTKVTVTKEKEGGL